MAVLLFIVAYVLYLPLTIVNFWFVKPKRGYFMSSAVSLDKFANREFRTLFNRFLIVNSPNVFGNQNETISSVLGKNQATKTLTPLGKCLCQFLDWLDKDHCKKSIRWA